MIKLPSVVFLVSALVLSACVARPGATPPPPTPTPTPTATPVPTMPTVSHDLVLRIAYVGGFVAPSWRFSQTPTLSVYADGRVITTGPQIEIYPGPLMPNLQVVKLTATGLARLLDAAAAAGLTGVDASYPPHGVADAPDTIFVVVRDGHRTTISFGALGIDSGVGAPPAEAAARAAAMSFVEKTGNLETLLGASEVGESESYVAEDIQILSWPGDPSADNDPALAREPVAWPLAVSLATYGAALIDVGLPDGARCAVRHGDDTAKLLPILNTATQLTGFSSAGVTYTVLPRPLLPDELGCGA